MQIVGNTLEHQWMGFTPNKHFKANPRLFTRAEGMYFVNHHGEKVLDASSGLFCSNAGHGRPEITAAVAKQIQEMDFAPPFQYGHPGAFELARRVCELTPEGLNYLFFVNSGSEAVETALKAAYAYHRARGEAQRIRFVGRERGYHGVNFGGMSVGGMMKNRESFGAGLPGVIHMRHTHIPENRFQRGEGEHGADLANDLQRAVELCGGDTIAACIVEPIAGSTGCLVPPKGYLKRLREICDKHGILLIFDEVICGFGRTGKAFGAQSFNVTPDILTMAKGITNGAVPMGAVAFRDAIYQTVIDATPGEGVVEFFHGYTYSGHPVACAAGLAALDIYKRDGLFERAAALSKPFLDRIFSLRDLSIVTDIRGYGVLGAVDFAPSAKPGQRGYQTMIQLFEAGIYARMIGETIILAPPFIAEETHLDQMVETIRKVLTRH